jgi:Arc/MetJ-type ribon-helix-helix transcriptional regulator
MARSVSIKVMATRSASAPLTFDLPISLIAKIESHRRKYGLKTASDVVRLAIDRFDFEGCRPARDPHRQVSVRLGANQRAMLKRFAKKKDASVGELLRFALEGLPAKKPKAR